MKNSLFYAKILLFGEYGIIENSRGLTLPYNTYKGTLQFPSSLSESQLKSNKSLYNFLIYLKKIELPSRFKLNLKSLEKDIENGMFFDSNIPQGYGVGSSGALVAAIFDKYSGHKVSPDTISKNDLKDLKIIFGKMESFFHGKSSGIDPLICYMNIPLLIQPDAEVDKAKISENNEGKGAVFLINSGIPGETEPMVKIFFEKLKNDGFRKTLKEEFIKYNNECIDSFLNKDMKSFFKSLKHLSSWALNNFTPMIPSDFLKIWEKGISSNTYYLKLCGSGGGGYILGFTEDYETTQELLKDYNKEIVYRF
ncbi:mevalonate kinase [Apibacter muscae]|uniref:Mevalonate kinase n=1 Tax=Apibacter muscae TaxID=2509004 RepID=A0A563DIE2_9FLAO|nr:mevalonate kinase [Apibacter muscae]TWP29852.1 mevalonate kinase [Apibacter muscae]